MHNFPKCTTQSSWTRETKNKIQAKTKETVSVVLMETELVGRSLILKLRDFFISSAIVISIYFQRTLT
ncbi:hypothetical protein L6452_32522 [Arctium lappa]|uniref:Uncharacterized protein n=1 Tax=Arctium lappa TaxID=4217 RepID=A0ACB8Z5Y4_ARCLA|nr:hypothetical protein L6452_32522 [Arctium lappa]